MRPLIVTAEHEVLEALANHGADATTISRLHRAEQDLLLLRLAADTGARRGELAALRLEDLTARVLTIERAVSAGQLRDTAGVTDATLHRLRHSVATFLVARGEILAAQARLGHADAATTLREYAHAVPLTDNAVADALDDHLNATARVTDHDSPPHHRG